MKDKVVVRFNTAWSRYYPGDVAGFDADIAKRLLEASFVNTEGKRVPVAVRQGSFLERAGVTKGQKPAPEPEPEPAPETPSQEEESEAEGKPKGRSRFRK